MDGCLLKDDGGPAPRRVCPNAGGVLCWVPSGVQRPMSSGKACAMPKPAGNQVVLCLLRGPSESTAYNREVGLGLQQG